MATIAIGDIHGNRAALSDVLGLVRSEVTPKDTVVFLGDYIDRGPDSRGCVDAILEFQGQVSAPVFCLRGNHEDWFLRTRHDHSRHSWLLGMEAFDTIQSYSAEAAHLLREAVAEAGTDLILGRCVLPYDAFFATVPEEHLRFFENLHTYYQGADCICTHGGLDTRIAELQRQPPEALMWGAGSFPNGYEGAELLVYGHHNNPHVDAGGWPTPAVLGRTIGIDTIAHGLLTAIRLPDRRVFQSARYEVARA